ncbi:MAG: hypothetical protein Q9219_003531 [cf. Caloplaca sp. 3 TL-2023]
MCQNHAIRRRKLEELVTPIRGRANLSKQKIVNFSSRDGPEKLRNLLAHAFTQRWEGLVLKPSNEPYFSNNQTSRGLPAHCWIKLKKDYIPGLGDTLDFAVVGAGYNATRAAQLHNPALKWTHFHIACLKNKEYVSKRQAKPSFVVTSALEVNLDMAKHLNQHGQYYAVPFGSLTSYQDPFEINIAEGVPKMDVIFRKPFVFDVVGAGFEKEPNRDFFTLRFPRAVKIHSDRDWRDCTSFSELQNLARIARTVPDDTKSCVQKWMERLEQVDRGAKGSAVPWDLSDDDTETPKTPSHSTRRSEARSTVTTTMIRMDTQEMTEKEVRLGSGEVIRSQATAWSESTLPTPPRTSSPDHEVHTTNDRQPLSSIQSTNTTDHPRKRSINSEEDNPGERAVKRPRQSPPGTKGIKITRIYTSTQQLANSKPPHSHKDVMPRPSQASPLNSAKHFDQTLAAKAFLVPKLTAGAAEALRFRAKSRVIRNMEATSPDRRTTADERSSGETRSAQGSSVTASQPHNTVLVSPPEIRLPDLKDSYIVLSPDVSGSPYLTEDLLANQGLASRRASHVLGDRSHTNRARPPISYHCDGRIQDMVIFVEPRRKDPTMEMSKFLAGRVPSNGSQEFWVFDWRLAEDMFALKINDEKKLIQMRLFAHFWYDAEGQLMWVSGKGDIKPVPRERIEESRGMSGAFLG